MLFQKILYRLDQLVSWTFNLMVSGGGDENGEFMWSYHQDVGPPIAIVGANGRIHTLTGYFTVHHYLDKGNLVKRIPARKDLKEGERLATQEEVFRHQGELQVAAFARRGKGMM